MSVHMTIHHLLPNVVMEFHMLRTQSPYVGRLMLQEVAQCDCIVVVLIRCSHTVNWDTGVVVKVAIYM